MAINPLSVALKGKGIAKSLQRSTGIVRRYGLTANRMDRTLGEFAAMLRQFDCSATFPITTVALQRNPHIISKYQAQGIEFAVHGYRHLDHSQLLPSEQSAHLTIAKQIFAQTGISARGFRCPYLRWNPDMLAALRQQAFTYDSSQALAWDLPDGIETPAYLHVLDFYRALSAGDYVSLPSLEDDLVCIPYSLPDDEALVERLAIKTSAQMNALWLAILHRTFELGELFTIGLHPERLAACQKPLAATLAAARSLSPSVWIARLDEIAAWWSARTEATVKITDVGQDQFQITVDGPPGTSVLARAVQVKAPTHPWAGGYQQIDTLSFIVQADKRPVIGVTPSSSGRLINFLRQQGYIVEKATDPRPYALYIDRADFAKRDERAMLVYLEKQESKRPLVRLGRWPHGAHSALSVTGDVDALTLWDYGMRFLGK